MLRNFFIISLRILLKQKLYSFINITGLALGMSVFILIMVFVTDEYAVDSYFKNADRIFRFETVKYTVTSGLQGDFLRDNFPQVEYMTRISEDDLGDVKINNQIFALGKVYIADSTFTRIFDIEFIYGNPLNALSHSESIILSQSTALKFFGNINPVGATITVLNENQFIVTGVFKDFGTHSSFQTNAIIPIHHKRWIENFTDKEKYQGDYNYLTYVLLHKNADTTHICKSFVTLMQTRFHDIDLIPAFKFVHLKDLYFDTDNFFDIIRHGNKNIVLIYILIGFFILLIACINFINLSTARTTQRAKEVGVKRVLGATRSNLNLQFVAESVVLSLLAMIIGVVLAELMANEFGSIIGHTIRLKISLQIFAVFIAGAIILGILAGIYPAFFMSGYEPSKVIRGELVKGHKGAMLRKLLILFQFVISIILVIASIVIEKQLYYIKNTNPGFNKEQIIYFQINPQIKNNIESFRNELLQNPSILKVCRCNNVPGQFTMYWGREINMKNREFSVFASEPEFADILELEIIEGRNFSKDIKSDENRAVLFNQKAVKEFNLEKPIGTTFVTIPGKEKATVVGVVRDFNFKSLHSAIEPMAIVYLPEWSQNYLMIKLSKGAGKETIDWIEKKFTQFAPDYIFDFQFLNQSFNNLYKKEENLGKIFIYFTGLAIVIALLGLFGLINYTAERYAREIGIRKAFGASETGIVLLLSGQFIKLILLANIIAYPAAYHFLSEWLSNFAYSIAVPLWAFLFSTLLTLSVAILTILYQSIKISRTNPVEILRYE